MKSNIFEKVLNNISLDPRIKDGVFSIEQNEHMDVLREYLSGRGVEDTVVNEFCNRVLEGKYPERQAYNVKGILVTFPTPEYKADAIKRGTHFEDDPTRKASNIFQNNPAPAKAEPKSEPGKTNLPLSNSAPADDGAAAPAAPSSPAPEAPAAPEQQAQAPTPAEKPAEPAPEPTELPPPPPKSPQEKQADAAAIKQMLNGDDYKLTEIVAFLKENISPKVYNELMERIRNV